MGVFTVLNMFFRLVSVLVGFLYPAYSSYKAVEMKNPEMMSLLLVYWCVFGLFSVLEVFMDIFLAQITVYYMGKLAFLIWLQMPQTKVRGVSRTPRPAACARADDDGGHLTASSNGRFRRAPRRCTSRTSSRW